MPDIDQIKALIELAFDTQVSRLVIQVLVVCLFLWLFLQLVESIKNIWSGIIQPLLYNTDEQHRSKLRRFFAAHVASEIERLNRRESWSDSRFSDLEAEVEAEGHWKAFSWIPFVARTRRGTRRVKSLSKALRFSTERYILIEGEPGSGKSVALRHVAHTLAAKAATNRSMRSLIPMYVNLKELERHNGEVVDRNFIESFILKSLNRVNDRDVESFLDTEFQRGLREQSWLFLFDSFDEIPEVLSSTEADEVIQLYADAITDFLHGMNQCRGILASRQFRGPRQAEFRRFLILSLSEERKHKLIKKALLSPKAEQELIGRLGTARPELQDMSRNPMFLGLLCQHIDSGQPFPEHGHNVFETYIDTRLLRDEQRVAKRFNVSSKELRAIAELVAFTMSAETAIGLSPTRERLKIAMKNQHSIVPDNFEVILDALEFIKIARTDSAVTTTSPVFTFAHRRFQEYFATTIVLREPGRISQRQLLTDGRWRETAVVLCQNQSIVALSPLVDEAKILLHDMLRNHPLVVSDEISLDSISQGHIYAMILSKVKVQEFDWPSGLLHLLGLLQDGFFGRVDDLPSDIRLISGRAIISAYTQGILLDKIYAVEVSGISEQNILTEIFRHALSEPSKALKNVVYQQVARIRSIPEDLASWIRSTIIYMDHQGILHSERYTTQAHLMRIDQSKHFISVMNLVLNISRLNLLMHLILMILIVSHPINYLNIIVKDVFLLNYNIATVINTLTQSSIIYYISSLTLIAFSFFGGIAGVYKFNLQETLLMLFTVLIRFILLITACAFYINVFNLYILTFILYTSIWSVSATQIASIGKYTGVVWWAFIPLVWLLEVLLVILSNIIAVMKIISKISLVKTTILIKVFFISLIKVFFILLIIALFLIGLFFSLSESNRNILIFTMVVLLIPAMLFTGIININSLIFSFLSSTLYKISDFIHWRRWVMYHRKTVDANILLEMKKRFYSKKYLYILLEDIRVKNLLPYTKSVEEALLQITLDLENNQSETQIPKFFDLSRYTFLKSMTSPLSVNSTRSAYDWGADALDEATLLLQHIRNKRRAVGETGGAIHIDIATTSPA